MHGKITAVKILSGRSDRLFMDVSLFINSPDIRKYLVDNNYSFNSLESAWLIWQSRGKPYEQKKAAWMELIAEMPDCVIPERNLSPRRESLHEFLKEYIANTDREIKEFCREETEGYVYLFSYRYSYDQEWTEDYETIFPSLKECMRAYKAEVNSLDESFFEKEDGKSTGVIWCRLKKQALKEPYTISELELNEKGEVMEVLQSALREGMVRSDLEDTFESLWFDIPTPFEKGDIVWDPALSMSSGPFVLMGLSTWDKIGERKAEKIILAEKEYGGFVSVPDISDMNGYGYFVDDRGLPYHEVMFHYLNLEYYHEPFQEYEKILLPISKFVKGKIGIDLLLCAYRNIILQKEMDRVISYKSWHLVDELEEVGLAADEDNG